jgi:5-methylthioribose kinase
MNRVLDKANIVEMFDKHHPKTPKECKKRGLKLQKIGSGLFRTVYRINDLDLVVKFPKKENKSSGLYHSLEEFRRFKQIQRLKKYKSIQRYLPKIHYFNKKSGVILMPFYRKLPAKEAEIASNILSKFAEDVGHTSGGDIHSENVMFSDFEDRYVLVDLGYF